MSLEGRSIGNYVIKSKLGEGGMGAVYLGEHPLIGKKVAIKVLREELASNEEVVRRFFNEARAVNDIHHQNIVDIVDFGKMPNGTGGEIAYIVMELLDGESLSARLRSTGLRVVEVVEIIQQCCHALAASHAKGIIHRDLKPENIYLCPRGPTRNFVKVLDFGIAKLTGDVGGTQTRTGTVMGTPYYMSPEQCEGSRTIDLRSDVYSLGVVMYELLTGQVPFPKEGFGAIIVAHITEPVPPPRSLRPSVPPELEAVVLRSLEKDRGRRFQTMDEFAEALGDPSWFGAISGRASAQMATVMHNTGRGSAPALRPITTLSGAASEVSQPVPLVPRDQLGGGGSRGALWAVLGLLVIGGSGGGFWFLRGGASAGQPQAAVAPPAAEEADKIKISFVSTPEGAKITRPDGSLVGTTPLKIEVARAAGDFDVAFSLDGYQAARRRVVADGDRELNVTLAPQAAAAPPPVVASHRSSRKVAAKPKGASAFVDDSRLLPSTLLDDPPKK